MLIIYYVIHTYICKVTVIDEFQDFIFICCDLNKISDRSSYHKHAQPLCVLTPFQKSLSGDDQLNFLIVCECT